jgi:hypothetical protein
MAWWLLSLVVSGRLHTQTTSKPATPECTALNNQLSHDWIAEYPNKIDSNGFFHSHSPA